MEELFLQTLPSPQLCMLTVVLETVEEIETLDHLHRAQRGFSALPRWTLTTVVNEPVSEGREVWTLPSLQLNWRLHAPVRHG